MVDEASDPSLVNRWRAGDEQAAQALFDRYVDRLVGIARRRLNHKLAGRVDAEDVVQSVFRTFFRRARDGKFSVNAPDDLWKLLARITFNKSLKQVERHQAAKRAATAEVAHGSDNNDLLLEILDPEPTPEAANQFVDQLEHFMQKLGPEERHILLLRLQGYGSEEIASKLGTYDRKIRRTLERIRYIAEQTGVGVTE